MKYLKGIIQDIVRPISGIFDFGIDHLGYNDLLIGDTKGKDIVLPLKDLVNNKPDVIGIKYLNSDAVYLKSLEDGSKHIKILDMFYSSEKKVNVYYLNKSSLNYYNSSLKNSFTLLEDYQNGIFSFSNDLTSYMLLSDIIIKTAGNEVSYTGFGLKMANPSSLIFLEDLNNVTKWRLIEDAYQVAFCRVPYIEYSNGVVFRYFDTVQEALVEVQYCVDLAKFNKLVTKIKVLNRC